MTPCNALHIYIVSLIGVCNDVQFSCNNGECVDAEMECDREYDCSDESDEWDCSKLF